MANIKKITWILTGLIAVLLIVNVYITLSMSGIAEDLASDAKEKARAGEIQIITLADTSCTDCFDIMTAVDSVKTANVEVTSEQIIEYTDGTAQELIEKYNIEKIPTIIVTGEINKEGSEIPGLEEESDALIFTNQDPVYFDISANEYKGRIQVKLITNSDCEDCYDMTKFIAALKDLVIISNEETIELDDAKELIEKYSLAEVPAIIISGDIELYPDTANKLEVIGTYIEEDLILTAKLNPPYWDIAEDKALGLVFLTYITDDSCENCYNVNIHKTVLENYGVFIAEESTIDISSDEGKALKEKYNLTKVPTVIVSEDLQYYSGIEKIWEQVGTIEEDGSYVFRELDLVSKEYTTLD
ncbi:MAG: hypothetical protein QT08_C0009G0006 [archaeon GW2011_AR17]|nr:MAG: hypothetical protein QT08_C0009G0006 [archaeon GW2011_AR17]MBS3154202.1 hypothetical protein [Candidatus Woesearchaeota archaeon]HIH14760.1 hypothetical protein [Nanoarchaeota archaeon]HIH58688.1 hypothetical protein [Nanoarchaeota archaeon]HII14476.1 hypothetical protein [Nanoarchaeota archaeon]